MRRSTTGLGSLWELAVLTLLREEPMHPYQMQRILRERREDEVLGLKRGSLYHAIHRLERAGLIEPVAVDREGRRPERTTYRLAAAGEKELVRWLRQRIATPQEAPSDFMGSISFLVHLAPRDAITQLESRAEALGARAKALAAATKQAGASVARVHLLERDYLLAMHEAELQWVRGLVDELRGRRLGWDPKAVLREVRAARRRTAPQEKER